MEKSIANIISFCNLTKIEFDHIKRVTYKKGEFERVIYFSILRNRYTSIVAKARCFLKISNMSRYYGLASHRNHCRLSGRTHFVLADAKLARMQFRIACGSGYLAGISRVGK